MNPANHTASWLARRSASVWTTMLLTLAVVGLSALPLAAQYRNLNAIQQRIRERMIREQGGYQPSVQFNNDSSFDSLSTFETRVRGTGIYFNGPNDRGRDFRYDAVFDSRNWNLRNLNYNFREYREVENNRRRGNTIFCSSDDGRRHQCPADTVNGVTLVTQRSDAPCVQGRTWGWRRNYIWVDRGCRADFSVGEDRGQIEPRHGSVTWTGRVDNDVKLVIYGNRIDTYVQSGKNYGPGVYQFNSPMPREAVVSVQRIRGRGNVQVVEQPSRLNRNSAVIRITDYKGGADDYEVVISW